MLAGYVSALVFGALLQSGCQRDAQADKKKPPGALVTVATVQKRDMPVEVRAFGLVEASNSVDVVSQVTGLVTEVHFKEGGPVEKGDLLFTIDTRPYRAALALAQADLARTRVLADQASLEAERFRNLTEQGVASEQQLQKAQADAAAAAASVNMGRAQAQSANLNVNFTRVTSPIAGRTGTLLIHPGNVVQANDERPLVVIRSLSPAFVRFAVPQEYVVKIRERFGQSQLSVHATPRGSRATPAEGVLTFIENTIDTTTGTLSLKAAFANRDELLWPGAAVDVELMLDVEAGAVVAPEAAIQAGQNGSYAYVVHGDKVERKTVVVQRTEGEQSVIRSGLAPGDVVVTDGQIRLRDGASISIQSAGKGETKGGDRAAAGLPGAAAPARSSEANAP